MVVDDYGRIALATAQRAERDRRAEQLGLSARLEFSTSTPLDRDAPPTVAVITVALEQYGEAERWPGGLLLQFIHPTRSELDRSAELAGSRGYYAGQLDRLPGRYYVTLSDADETWRLTGEIFDATTVLELHARGRVE